MRAILPIRKAVAVLAVSVALVVLPAVGQASEPYCNVHSKTAPNCYFAVDDGTLIALSVHLGEGCSESHSCPTVFEMSGYDGASADPETGHTMSGEFLGSGAQLADDSRQLTFMFDGDYNVVHASVRGSGCSQGEFDLFSTRAALDGYQIIENFIVKQPWATDKVAIMGHSYGGITGFMVGAMEGRAAVDGEPNSLVVMTVSGLIDDLYRGITYLGGVSNFGFPLLWTGGIRNAYDIAGGKLPGLARPIYRPLIGPMLPGGGVTDGDPKQSQQCLNGITGTPGQNNPQTRAVFNDPILQGAVGDTDGPWWQIRSPINYVKDIHVPIHISAAYQDEQTGPRGPTHLWEQVAGVSKRLLLSNGDHGTNQDKVVFDDRRCWVDQFMEVSDGEHNCPTTAYPAQSVRVLLETHGGMPNGELESTVFPLPDTTWTTYYLHANNGLSTVEPTADEGVDTYFNGSQRQGWFWEAGPTAGAPLTTHDGPDEVTYSTSELAAPITIVGPIMANIWLSSVTPDTELFVQLIDENVSDTAMPIGARTYLQRGLLKASHRAIDPARSDCVDASNARVSCADEDAVRMYRPWRPHTNPSLITPGQPILYEIEIFPVGHVFRAGHKIEVKIMAPPAVDSYYAYILKTPRGLNTVIHDPAYAGCPAGGCMSSIVFPEVPTPPLGSPVGCGEQEAVRCVPNPNG